jgi:CBS-domain-containing membrane protein
MIVRVEGDRHYTPLAARPVEPGTTFHQPAEAPAPRVSLEDPAVSVMTDLARVVAVTIDPEATIEHAMRVMVRRNVRLLFVVDIDNAIVGLITATDLLGEKPLLHLREHRGRRGDIRVRDIMTRQDRLEAIALEDLQGARVGHVLATLRHAHRQHALVAARDERGRMFVRGLLSASQLGKQLGVEVQTSGVAHTFAEIEAALAPR